MTPNRLCEFLVAACAEEREGGGVYRFGLYANGTLQQLARLPMPCPTWIEEHNGLMTVLLRNVCGAAGAGDSGIAYYRTADGARVGEILPTQGKVGCHFCAAGADLYVANYLSGSAVHMPHTVVAHEGHGKDPIRQEAPHVHCTFFSLDKQYILSCDLGLDTVYVYDRNLREVSTARVPDGHGPRHLVFSKDGRFVYVVNEMGGSVSTFGWSEGILTYKSTLSLMPGGAQANGTGKGAAIRLSFDGTRLYTTERASESIVLLRVGEDGTLEVTDRVASRGAEPRDFMLLADESFAVCANQFSDVISLYRVGEKGKLTFLTTVALPRPLCVVELAK